MRTRNRRSAILAGVALAALAIGTASLKHPIVPRANAQDAAAGRAELEKAIVSLRPRASLDTTPIEFSVGGIHYRVPRNYLTTVDNWNGGPQGLVTLTVNLPDLKPLSQETLACFTAKPLERPPGCEPYSFRINAPGGPSADQAFERNRDLFRTQIPTEGQSGFEKYEIGPTAGSEYYRKVENGRTLFYICKLFDNRGKQDGICDPVGDRLSTGAVIHFFFNLRHLNDITQIDANLRNLAESFTIQSGDAK